MQTYLWDITIIMPSSVKRILNSKYTGIAIILIISIGVYLNTLPNEFVYDDEVQVLKNLWIKDAKYIPEIFLSNAWASEGKESLSNYYRPLMNIIYMIDYHIFGLKPWGFHLTNIIFHAGVSVLVFIIVSMLINQSHDLNSKPEQAVEKVSKHITCHSEPFACHSERSEESHLSAQDKLREESQLFAQGKLREESHFFKVTEGEGFRVTTKKNFSTGYEILNPPFIAALLFAVHPIHTEAAAWVGGIPELSFTLFYLLSFYLYINSNKRYTPLNPLSRGESKNKRWGKGFILSVLFFFLATLCKETALTIPILLFVYDYSLNRNSVYGSRLTVHRILKRYLPYLIVSIIYFILRTYAIGMFAPLKRHTQLSNYEYFINIFPLFTRYLEKLLLPINMNAFYVFHPISSIFQLKGIIALIVTLGFVFLLYFFRRHKIIFLCFLWIVIPLLPVLYIPVLGENTFAERYLYLPSIGFVVLTALTIERISQLKALRQSANYAIVSILIILTGLYSTGTIKRNHIWKDSYTLWIDTTKKSPDGYLPHYNLALIYSRQERFGEAIKEYVIAMKLNPDYPDSYNNLGNIYSNLGRFDDAIKEYTIALKLKPNYYEARNNLGNAYVMQGKLDEAIKEYLIVLKFTPEDAETHNNIANAYIEKGEIDKAIEHYEIALNLNPNYYEAHYNLGFVYLETGLKDRAEEEFKTALQLKPDFAPAREALESINRER